MTTLVFVFGLIFIGMLLLSSSAFGGSRKEIVLRVAEFFISLAKGWVYHISRIILSYKQEKKHAWLTEHTNSVIIFVITVLFLLLIFSVKDDKWGSYYVPKDFRDTTYIFKDKNSITP